MNSRNILITDPSIDRLITAVESRMEDFTKEQLDKLEHIIHVEFQERDPDV